MKNRIVICYIAVMLFLPISLLNDLKANTKADNKSEFDKELLFRGRVDEVKNISNINKNIIDKKILDSIITESDALLELLNKTEKKISEQERENKLKEIEKLFSNAIPIKISNPAKITDENKGKSTVDLFFFPVSGIAFILFIALFFIHNRGYRIYIKKMAQKANKNEERKGNENGNQEKHIYDNNQEFKNNLINLFGSENIENAISKVTMLIGERSLIEYYESLDKENNLINESNQSLLDEKDEISIKNKELNTKVLSVEEDKRLMEEKIKRLEQELHALKDKIDAEKVPEILQPPVVAFQKQQTLLQKLMDQYNSFDVKGFNEHVSPYRIKNFDDIVIQKSLENPVFCEDSDGRMLITSGMENDKYFLFLSPLFPIEDPARDDLITPVFDINFNSSQSNPIHTITPAVVKKRGYDWSLVSRGKISIKR